MEGPIIIAGAQRSGTTMLRIILNSHSQVAIPEEASFLMPLLERNQLNKKLSGVRLDNFIKYLALNPQYKLWNYNNEELLNELRSRTQISVEELVSSLYESYAKSESKTIWGDKTPSFFRKLDLWLELFPNARVVHIVRDGRDVFLSWRAMDSTRRNGAVMAIEWKHKVDQIQESLRRYAPNSSIEVQYEELISEPRATLQKICDFCGIAFEEQMLEFYKKSDRYIGNHHSSLIFQPITSSNKAKWVAGLNKKEKATFNLLAGKKLIELGYERAPVGTSLLDIIRVGMALIWGVPVRLWEVFRIKLVHRSAMKQGAGVSSIPAGELPKANVKQN